MRNCVDSGLSSPPPPGAALLGCFSVPLGPVPGDVALAVHCKPHHRCHQGDSVATSGSPRDGRPVGRDPLGTPTVQKRRLFVRQGKQGKVTNEERRARIARALFRIMGANVMVSVTEIGWEDCARLYSGMGGTDEADHVSASGPAWPQDLSYDGKLAGLVAKARALSIEKEFMGTMAAGFFPPRPAS